MKKVWYAQSLTGLKLLSTITHNRAKQATPDVSFCWPRIGSPYTRWLLIHRAPWTVAPRNTPRPAHRCRKLSFSHPNPDPRARESKEFFVASKKTTGSWAIAMNPSKIKGRWEVKLRVVPKLDAYQLGLDYLQVQSAWWCTVVKQLYMQQLRPLHHIISHNYVW